jgi:hypothetical protein
MGVAALPPSSNWRKRMNASEHVLWERLEPEPEDAAVKVKAIKVSIVVDIIALVMVSYGLFILPEGESLGALRYLFLVILAIMAMFQIMFMSYSFSPITKPLLVYSDGLVPPQSVLGRFRGVPEFLPREQIESLELVIFRFSKEGTTRSAEMMKANPRMKLRGNLRNGKKISLAERRPEAIRGVSERMGSSWGVQIKELFIDV